jgi:tetratricopeptide (TPR) repeat protein
MRSSGVLAYFLLLVTSAVLSLAQAPAATPDQSLLAARQLYRRGDFPAAAIAFRRILVSAPSPEAYAGLAQTLLKQDDVAAADEASRAALQAFPASALAVATRGDVLFRRGLIAEAQGQYAAALRLDGQCARAWLGQGKVDAALARRHQALEAVTRAHDLDPEDGDALYEWAIRQPYPGNVAGLEKHLSEFRSDPETEGHERDYLELLKALAGRSVWLLKSDVSRSELKLDALTTGPSFALRGYGVRVKFNGRAAATLLLDTGSSGVIITRKFAEKIGARKLSDKNLEGIGKNGAAHGYEAWVDQITIGDLEFHDCFVHVIPGSIADTDGFIGTDVFEKFLITLDFPARKVRLDPLPEANVTEGGASPSRDPRSLVQVYAFGHLLLLPTEVDTKQSGLFVLDSGGNISTISPELAKRISQMRTLNAPVRGTSGVVNSAQVADDVGLRFGNVLRKERIITVDMRSVSKDLGTEISGQLGFSTLERMRITINYRDGLIDFEFK